MDSIEQSIARRPVAASLLMFYPISWGLFIPSFLGKLGLGFLPVETSGPALMTQAVRA